MLRPSVISTLQSHHCFYGMKQSSHALLSTCYFEIMVFTSRHITHLNTCYLWMNFGEDTELCGVNKIEGNWDLFNSVYLNFICFYEKKNVYHLEHILFHIHHCQEFFVDIFLKSSPETTSKVNNLVK